MKALLLPRVLLLVALIATASVDRARGSGNIIAYPDASGSVCGITDAGGVVEVHLFHSYHSGATGSQFAIDASDPGWIHLADTWAVSAIGNSASGVTTSYGGCSSSPVYLGSVMYAGMSAPCSHILLGPSPTPVSFNCSSNPVPLTSTFIGSVNCGPCGIEAPYNMLPANSAEAVALSPTLSWSWDQPTGCPEGIGLTISTVYLGTDPDDLSAVGWIDWNSPPFELTVGPLLPYTLYYWRVGVEDSYWLCPDNESSSGMQSFTTVIPVGAEYSTWGRVKSLYR